MTRLNLLEDCMARLTETTSNLQYDFQNEVIAFQPHPRYGKSYILYVARQEFSDVSLVVKVMSLMETPRYVLTPQGEQAKFANQESQGLLKIIDTELLLVHVPGTGKLMLKMIEKTTELLMRQGAKNYH